MTDRPSPGLEPLRPSPAGLPSEQPTPPVVAESGDPFAAIRVVQLLACMPRGVAVPVRALVDRLNATHIDWLFDERVVADVILQLQANWMADYRNTSGIVVDEAGGVTTVTIEDSSRVDPWIVRQAERELRACREALLEFSRRDRPTGE
ncbi:MAG TPA: hypothetical protein VF494_03390 [Candidatus Limnocylindrales bacterium]